MRMQVVLDSSFARPGWAPIWGGKKGEFRDWTSYALERLFATRNRQCPRTNILAHFRAKWRLLLIYSTVWHTLITVFTDESGLTVTLSISEITFFIHVRKFTFTLLLALVTIETNRTSCEKKHLVCQGSQSCRLKTQDLTCVQSSNRSLSTLLLFLFLRQLISPSNCK